MALKDIMDVFGGKKSDGELVRKDQAAQAIMNSGDFPVLRASELDAGSYKKIPLAGMAALGASFAQLPASARTMVQTVQTTIKTNETLFVGVNPKNVQGFLRMNDLGTVGNIIRENEQGKQVIAGRMRFKPVGDLLPGTQTTTTVLPIDPTTMMIAAALMQIEKKLDNLQKTADDILRFLTVDKQSRQRGNLNVLGEIFEEYKQDCSNEKRNALRNVEVQAIKREAQQDILFYQEQIAKELQKQQLIHGLQQAQSMLEGTSKEFQEYRLACYLYAFASFLDVLLQKSFESAALDSVKRKMEEISDRYRKLYSDCRTRLEKYQKTSLETQLIGGIGSLAKTVGKAIGSVPVLRDGSVDEALIHAGDTLDSRGQEWLAKKLERFEELEDDRMRTFIENVQSVDLLYNQPRSMLTDGESIYILERA